MGSKILILLIVLSLITLFSGCTLSNNVSVGCTEEAKICPDGSAVGRVGPNCEFAPCPQIVGGDKDEHGCIPSAGYSWCEEKQKCLRVWEEDCGPKICTMEYAPVCAATYLPLDCNCPVGAMCKCPTQEIIKTYGNLCMAEADYATILYNGECSEEDSVFCTMDVKLCSDGNYVGRVGPNCEFAPCPNEEIQIPNDCTSWYDGCNTCGVENGELTYCTLMYCETPSQPYCKTYSN